MDEEGRHSDLVASAGDGPRRPHRVQRHGLRRGARAARRARPCVQREIARRHRAQASVLYAIRTACRSRSISEANGDGNEDHGLRIHRCRAHGRAHGAAPAQGRHQPHGVRHVEGSHGRARERRRASRELGARGREQHRGRVPEPADARHRAEGLLGPHGREEDENRRRLLDDGPRRRAHRARGAREGRHRLHGRARQRRHGRRARRHARRHGLRQDAPSTTASSPRSSSSASCSSAAKARASRRS